MPETLKKTSKIKCRGNIITFSNSQTGTVVFLVFHMIRITFQNESDNIIRYSPPGTENLTTF